MHWTVFIAQLAELSLSTPENVGSNPAISLVQKNCFQFMRIKKKEAENGPLKIKGIKT